MQRFELDAPLTAHNFNKKTRLVVAVSLIALSLVGCGHSGDKVANKDKTSTSDKPEKLDCGSANVASVIQQATIHQISQQATTNVQQLAQQAGIANTNIDPTSLVGQMNVAVTNPSAIAGQSDQCQANIAVTLPQSVLTKANQIATSLNQPAIAQNLASKGLNLDNNTITAINAVFKLSPAEGSYKATPSNGTSTANVLVTEVGNLIGNAQLAQLIGTAGNVPALSPASTTATADSAITNEPTSASSNAISNASTTNSSQVSNQAITSHAPVIASPAKPSINTSEPKPVTIKKTTTTEKTTKKAQESVGKDPKNTHKAVSEKKVIKTSENSAVKEKSPVKKSSDGSLGPAAVKTETGPAAKPKAPVASQKDSGPAAKPVSKSANDDDIKVTIEEKNEKY